MWSDQVSNPGPLAYESGALPIALRGPAPGSLIVILHGLPCRSCYCDQVSYAKQLWCVYVCAGIRLGPG